MGWSLHLSGDRGVATAATTPCGSGVRDPPAHAVTSVSETITTAVLTLPIVADCQATD
jgi:hypothetical protein